MLMPGRKRDSHKGDYGHLMVIGGSPGLTGAVCLASMSALRCGCGLVTAAIPKSLNGIIEAKLTEAMSLPLPETERGTFSPSGADACLGYIEKRVDAIVIGPGISTDCETAIFARRIISESGRPLVIDADAIRIISGDGEILRNLVRGSILTPHPGEMSCLTGEKISEIEADREGKASFFAGRNKTVLLLKGHRTVITDGKETSINLTGNPGMATAGSGDVLAGMIGGLLVRGFGCYEAARRGACIHGLAGDLAAREKGEESLVASDIMEKIPEVLMRMKAGRRRRSL